MPKGPTGKPAAPPPSDYACPDCGADVWESDHAPDCPSHTELKKIVQDALKPAPVQNRVVCKACLGTGRNSKNETCYPCAGTGRENGLNDRLPGKK